ncbi:MAG: N-acetyltransferase [Pseudomonadota bacterium]
MFTLTPETPDDFFEVEYLFDHAFAPGRTALSSYRLRDGVAPVAGLSRLARDEGGVLGGAIRYWPIWIGDAACLLLGPVAVHATRQGEGLGALLIEDSLAAARAAGWQRVVLVGDAPYYRRFGFSVLPNVVFPPPTNAARVLARALRPGALDGLNGKARPWTTVEHDRR